jgi:hypothetical protein
MTPDTLLRWAVGMLPARRRDWGRAMQAELAGLERGRWSFAFSCARGVLGRPETLLRLVPRLLAVGTLAAVVWLLADIRAGVVRLEAIAMVSALAAALWLARPARIVGAAGAAILAAEALLFLHGLRLEDGATTVIAVWTAMLTIYAAALRRAPARGAAIGAGAAAAWLAAAVVDPAVPTSSAPALLVIALAAVCAGGRIPGLCAAATAALLIAVSIDGPLRLFSPWVANSAPPVYPPESVERLVDSIGIWLVGCLLAIALSLAGHANVTWTRRRGVTLTP